MQPVGYGAWYYVLKRYPVNKVMPVLLILPVTGLITSIFLLGEDPPKQVFFGGLIIIIGVGGISSGLTAYEKLKSGANLLQLYTGMVYEGPGIVKKIKGELIDILKKEKIKNVGEIIGTGS